MTGHLDYNWDAQALEFNYNAFGYSEQLKFNTNVRPSPSTFRHCLLLTSLSQLFSFTF